MDDETPAKTKPSASAPPPPKLSGRGDDSVDYAPKFPDYHRVSWSEATKEDNKIDIDSKGDFGFEDVDDYDEGLDEFHEMPSFKGVIDWWICALFDCLLLVVEVGINLWLASSLYEQELIASYQSIAIILALPCIVNPLLWVGIKSHYKELDTLYIFIIAIIGFPSPLFVYIWHLYLAMFSTRSDALRSKQLANTFRMSQALFCSVPVILINLYTLINVFRVPGKEHHEVDISRLSFHLSEVEMHGLALIISLFNLVRAASLFNERQSFSLLFVLVGFPFILLTVLTRLLSLGIIVTFLKPEWTAILLLGCTFVNILLYVCCRKRRIVYPPKSTKNRKYLKPLGTSDEELEMDDVAGCSACSSPDSETDCNCCSLRNRSYTYAVDDKLDKAAQSRGTDDNLKGGMLKIIVLSVASILVPCSYTNDSRNLHPRLKGGLFILLNFITSATLLGSALGYAILNHVPNIIRGLTLPQPQVKVNMPSSPVMVSAMGLDLSLEIPHTKMNLGEMPAMSVDLNLTSNDSTMAIAIPILLALLVLPFVAMRAAMMEYDCFVTRRKLLDVIDDETYRKRKKNSTSTTSSVSDQLGRVTLVDTIARNVDSKEMKARTYVTICCGILGMTILVVVFMLLGALIVMNLIKLSSSGH